MDSWNEEHQNRFGRRLEAKGWKKLEAPNGCANYVKGGCVVQLDGGGLWVFEKDRRGNWPRTRGLDFSSVNASVNGARDRRLDGPVGPFADGLWLDLVGGRFVSVSGD